MIMSLCNGTSDKETSSFSMVVIIPSGKPSDSSIGNISEIKSGHSVINLFPADFLHSTPSGESHKNYSDLPQTQHEQEVEVKPDNVRWRNQQESYSHSINSQGLAFLFPGDTKLSRSLLSIGSVSGLGSSEDPSDDDEISPSTAKNYSTTPPGTNKLLSSSPSLLSSLRIPASSSQDDVSRTGANYNKSEPKGDVASPGGSIRATTPGTKKVEFKDSDMGLGDNRLVHLHESNNKEKGRKSDPLGTTSRRRSRSPSGNLFNEIRKMSLASQDAEDEKKKQLSGAEGGTVTSTKKSARRQRRIKRRREEEYTDKDRAAAVTLGTKDIKQSLKAKKKREKKLHLSIDLLNSEEYLSSMLVLEASYQMRVKKQPTMALTTLNKALELQPTHKGALVARSQCHLKLGDAHSALKDAETSFDKNETFIQGLFQYAEALFHLGEFEKALIAYHQGYKLRKDMEGFRIGVQKSQEAIRRAIGDRSATKMSNLDEILSIIGEFEDTKKKGGPFGSEQDSVVLQRIVKRRYGDKALAPPGSKSKDQWITREVMGQMYMDKDYLSKFVNRPDIKGQSGNSEALRENALEALKYLESREQFWRQQNPLYSRKNTSAIIDKNSLLSRVKNGNSCPPKDKVLQLKWKQVMGDGKGQTVSSVVEGTKVFSKLALIEENARKKITDKNNNTRKSTSNLLVSVHPPK